MPHESGYFLQTALPGGYRNTDGSFNNVGDNGNWWSATENSATNGWNRNLNYTEARVNRNTNNKANGFSVRCVKDWKKPAPVLFQGQVFKIKQPITNQ